MANLDTRSKRASSVQILLPTILAPILPDGTIDEGDRHHAIWTYSGISAFITIIAGDINMGWVPGKIRANTVDGRARVRTIDGRDRISIIDGRSRVKIVKRKDRPE